MPSINLDLGYFDHIKTVRLVTRLGPGADVLPLRLWAYVGRHNPGGGSVKMTDSELEYCLRWWGEKGALCAALVDFNFVTRDGDLWLIHDWLEHSGHLSEFHKRALKANRIRWSKWRKLRTPTRTPQTDLRNPLTIPTIPTNTTLAPQPKRTRFVPPTPEEVTAYAREIGFQVDAKHFCDHYAAGGWKRGKTPISNWKACLRTWQSNNAKAAAPKEDFA